MSWLDRLALVRAVVQETRLWPRLAVVFVAGILAATAFPPVGFFPALWLSFPVVILMVRQAGRGRDAFLLGWAFAFGMLVAGLYWISLSMLINLATYWWAIPLAVAGLPAILALYYGLAAWGAWRLGARGATGATLFALLWFVADYARGHLFSGLPWNLEGYVWDHLLAMQQLASVTGIYGLTLITLVAACMPAAWVSGSRRARQAVGLSLIILMLIALWGTWRLGMPTTFVPDVRLRLVQPNIEQKEKWQESQKAANFDKLRQLSMTPSNLPITHVIWPETASPYYLAADLPHRLDASKVLAANGILMTGIIRGDLDALGKIHYYNSFIAFDAQARIVGLYDKVHLVPYGEYMPLRRLFVGIPTVAAMGEGFSHGDHAASLHLPGLPAVSPMICYEAIFSGTVANRENRPGLLVNITNDAWFGRSSGPYQHLAIARMRAIEEGLPLARVANTGISAMIDPYGRTIAEHSLGEIGVIDTALPVALPTTIFVRVGEYPLWAIFVVIAGFCVARRARIASWNIKFI